MITYSPSLGNINEKIEIAIKMADIAKDSVVLTFNDTDVTIYPTHADQVYVQWSEIRAKQQAEKHND